MIHVSGQTANPITSEGLSAGAVGAANGAGAAVFELAGGVAMVAGMPIFDEGSVADNLQELSEIVESDPHLLEGWFSRIDGCFAFILSNRASGRCLIANDRHGGMPIYYSAADGILYFASEVKAVASALGNVASISPERIREFFEAGYLRPPHTYYGNISQAPPHCALLVDTATGSVQTPRIFPERRTATDESIGFDQAKDALKDRLRNAIAARLSSAPAGDIAVTLSGGLDSRILIAEARRRGPVRAITYGMPDSSEVEIASRVARTLGVPHQLVPIDSSNWLEDRDSAVWMTDGMMDIAHTHIVHTAKALRDASCVLDGLFGDVVLGRGEITVDRSAGRKANRYLRINRFTYFGPRIEQNFAPVFTPLVDSSLVDFMDSLPSRFTAHSRLYREAIGEMHPGIFREIGWHKTGTKPYPYRRQLLRSTATKAMKRTAHVARCAGMPLMNRDITMDYGGWYRSSRFTEMCRRLIYGRAGMVRDYLAIPEAGALLRPRSRAGGARLGRLLTLELWLRQAQAGRALGWEELGVAKS